MHFNPIQRNRLLARLFARPIFRGLGDRSGREAALRFIRRHSLLRLTSRSTLADVFEQAWQELRIGYRNEYVYKSEVANRLIFGRHSPRTAALHIELPVGRSIVDVAVFNGSSAAYEIKTEFDSARRIQTQTRDYLKVFDRVFLVTAPCLVRAYGDVADPRVGILSLGANGSLTVFREASSNQDHIRPEMVFMALRRDEYVRTVEEAIGHKVSLPNGVIVGACREVFTTFSSAQAHLAFVRTMRNRTTTPDFVDFVSKLPSSLRVLGYATPLSLKQRGAVLASLGMKITA